MQLITMGHKLKGGKKEEMRAFLETQTFLKG